MVLFEDHSCLYCLLSRWLLYEMSSIAKQWTRLWGIRPAVCDERYPLYVCQWLANLRGSLLIRCWHHSRPEVCLGLQLVMTDSRQISKIQPFERISCYDGVRQHVYSNTVHGCFVDALNSWVIVGPLCQVLITCCSVQLDMSHQSLLFSLAAVGLDVTPSDSTFSVKDVYTRNSLWHFSMWYFRPWTVCFDGLSLPRDSNLSHAQHFALLAFPSTLQKCSQIEFVLWDISNRVTHVTLILNANVMQ